MKKIGKCVKLLMLLAGAVAMVAAAGATADAETELGGKILSKDPVQKEAREEFKSISRIPGDVAREALGENAPAFFDVIGNIQKWTKDLQKYGPGTKEAMAIEASIASAQDKLISTYRPVIGKIIDKYEEMLPKSSAKLSRMIASPKVKEAYIRDLNRRAATPYSAYVMALYEARKTQEYLDLVMWSMDYYEGKRDKRVISDFVENMRKRGLVDLKLPTLDPCVFDDKCMSSEMQKMFEGMGPEADGDYAKALENLGK